MIGNLLARFSNDWKLLLLALPAILPDSAPAVSSGYFYERTNYVVSSPYGVKLGDLDNDGDQDLAIARPSGSRVYTNNGGVFYNSGQTLDNWYELDVADFNGDGAPDLYGGGYSSGRVWTNNGHGVFSAFGPTTTNAYTMKCAGGDLTGDGYPDLVVADWDGPSKVWTNNRTGRLLYSETVFATNADTVALGDLTGDGLLDCICGKADTFLLVYTNDRKGKLVYDLQNLALGSSYGVSAAMGDVNGDTHADVLLGQYGENSKVWTNNGAGKLFDTGQSLNSLNVDDALLADVDGDGDLDAILSQSGYGPAIWINTGSGIFTLRPHSFSNGGSTWGTCGDVDGDGDVDIVVSDLGNRVRVYINEWATMTVFATNGVELANNAAPSFEMGTDFGGPYEPGAVFTNTFTITNGAPVQLVLNPAVTNGAGASQFVVVGLSNQVNVQGTSTFRIQYRPIMPGVVEASVRITNSSSNAVFVLNLRGEATLLSVTNVSPANAEPAVLARATVFAQASQRLLSSTVSTNTFLLRSGLRGYLSGTVSYNDATRSATFAPEASLLPGERVVAQLTRGVSNAWSTAELPPYAWTFDAVAAGCGEFGDSGQTICTNSTEAALFGDVDGDGDLDAFLVNFTAPDEVWTNDGSGLFYDSGQRLGANAGRFAAFGDVDRDGDLDVYVVNWTQPAVLWSNDGSGLFTDSGQVLPGGNGRQVGLEDVNGDGWLDAVVTRQDNAGLVLTNNGFGLFTTNQALAITASLGAALGDVNGDGYIDLLLANWTKTNTVYFGDGDGAFTKTDQSLGTNWSRDVALGDLDNDGDFDVFFAHDNGQGNEVWTNDGTGVFTDSGQSLGADDTRGVNLGDFDGDGDLDAFVCNYGQSNRLWINDGHGVFVDGGTVGGANLSWRGAAGDVNGDGALDILAANEGTACELWFNTTPEMHVHGLNGDSLINGAAASIADGTDYGRVLLNTDVSHTFVITNAGVGDLVVSSVVTNGTDADRFVVTAWPSRIAPGGSDTVAIRFTPDGWGTFAASVLILNNSTNMPFVLNLAGRDRPARVTTADPANGSNAVASDASVSAYFSTNVIPGDVTADRFLVWSGARGYLTGVITTGMGGLNATFDPSTDYLAGEQVSAQLTYGIDAAGGEYLEPYAWTFMAASSSSACHYAQQAQILSNASEVAAGDLNGDGWLDVALASGRVFTNDGTGVLCDAGQNTGGSGDIKLADINRDGSLDLIYENLIATNDGTGVFGWHQNLGVSDTRCAEVGDVNGDGWPDVVIGAYTGANILTNDGSGRVYNDGQKLTGNWVNALAIGDLNNDGWLDMVALYSSVKVYTNDGTGRFGLRGNYDTDGTVRYAVQLADVDGDGNLDVAEGKGNSSQTCRILKNDGTGALTVMRTLSFSAFGNDMAFGDANGDGWLDIAIASDRSGCRMYLGDGTGQFSEIDQRFDTDDRQAIAFADINRDGELDLLIAHSSAPGSEVWLSSYNDFVFLGTNGDVVANGEAVSVDKGTLFTETAPQGLEAAQHVFRITNPAPAEVEIVSKSISGDQAAAFSFGDTPSIIAGGTASNFAIVATPAAYGLNTAVVTIVHTGTNSPFLVPLACSGMAPVVTALLPPNGTESALRHTNVSVNFSWAVETNSVTSERLFTWSESRGFNRGAISFSAGAKTALLTPDRFFRGGERVFAELMSGTTNAEGTAEIEYRAWTFFAEAEGSGTYIPSGRLLETSDVRRAAMGDLNGDDMVDAFLATAGNQSDKVWTNDGSGRFYDTGQALGTNDGQFAALGDFDNDGDLDAFVANFNQPSQVWTNDGHGVFGDSGQTLLGGQAVDIAIGDMDGDGDLDAVVVCRGQDTFLLLNDGQGFFTDSGQVLYQGRGVDIADVNGDGFLDMAVTRYSASVAGQIWTNNGKGEFAYSGDFGPGSAWSVAFGDVNGDRHIDLYMTVSSGGDQVWTNDGTGGFYDTGQALGSYDTRRVVLGDVNGDGDLDAFTVNFSQPSVLWTNDGAGWFYDSGQAVGTGAFQTVTLVDVDGDADLDIYLPDETSRDQLWINESVNLLVLGTNGQAILSEESPSLAKGTDFGSVWRQTRATNWFGITNSGQSALTISAVTTGGVNYGRFIIEEWPPVVDAGTVSNLAVVFDPTFSGAISALVTLANSSGVSPYYLNVQGFSIGVFVTNTAPTNAALNVPGDATVTVQFSTGMETSQIDSNRFFTHSAQRGFGRGAVAMNGDAEAILTPTETFAAGERVFMYVSKGITNDIGTTELTPWAGSFRAKVGGGFGEFILHQSPSNTADSRDVALGDFDGDGDLDAWIANNGVDDQVWTNDGTGLFYDSGQSLGSTSARGVGLADVDNDGDLDAFVANYGSAAYVWLNDGMGVFTQGQNRAMDSALNAVFADVDGDGDQDYFTGRSYYWGRIYLNNGDGTFVSSINIGSGMLDTQGPSFGDLDGDGDLDLYICDSASYPDWVWLNNGSGGFSKFSSVVNNNGTWAELGDLDGDGDLDAFVSRSSGGNRVRFNDGAAVFTDSGQLLGSATSRDVALGDFDNDGDLDAFIANQGSGNAVWLNDGSGFFSGNGQMLGSGASKGVAVGDLDGDGDLDAFVVNNGQDHEVWINTLIVRVTGEAGAHGSISPAGVVELASGATTHFFIAADSYYWIDELLTNGLPDADAAQARIYTSWWMNVTADGTASVTFSEAVAPRGTPEQWMAAYGLTNSGQTFAEAEAFDYDDDTFDAGDEYIADTDPTDDASYFQIDRVVRTNSIAVTFGSSTARVYSLEHNGSLITGHWSRVTGPITGSASGATTLVDTNAASYNAYRIGVSLP